MLIVKPKLEQVIQNQLGNNQNVMIRSNLTLSKEKDIQGVMIILQVCYREKLTRLLAFKVLS